MAPVAERLVDQAKHDGVSLTGEGGLLTGLVQQVLQSAQSGIAKSIAVRYADCMAQLVTRVEDELAAAVDQLVEAGMVASRSEAVRLGLERLVDRFRRDEIGAQIARGYRDQPQSDAEIGWADESSVRMIAEESW